MNEIFKKLVKEKISPNSLYVLYCIKQNIKVSDLVNEDLEKIRLLTNDWLNDDLSLSQKSIIFTEEIDSYFKKSKRKLHSKLWVVTLKYVLKHTMRSSPLKNLEVVNMQGLILKT